LQDKFLESVIQFDRDDFFKFSYNYSRQYDNYFDRDFFPQLSREMIQESSRNLSNDLTNNLSSEPSSPSLLLGKHNAQKTLKFLQDSHKENVDRNVLQVLLDENLVAIGLASNCNQDSGQAGDKETSVEYLLDRHKNRETYFRGRKFDKNVLCQTFSSLTQFLKVLDCVMTKEEVKIYFSSPSFWKQVVKHQTNVEVVSWLLDVHPSPSYYLKYQSEIISDLLSAYQTRNEEQNETKNKLSIINHIGIDIFIEMIKRCKDFAHFRHLYMLMNTSSTAEKIETFLLIIIRKINLTLFFQLAQGNMYERYGHLREYFLVAKKQFEQISSNLNVIFPSVISNLIVTFF
jgi:hypothetical protein